MSAPTTAPPTAAPTHYYYDGSFVYWYNGGLFAALIVFLFLCFWGIALWQRAYLRRTVFGYRDYDGNVVYTSGQPVETHAEYAASQYGNLVVVVRPPGEGANNLNTDGPSMTAEQQQQQHRHELEQRLEEEEQRQQDGRMTANGDRAPGLTGGDPNNRRSFLKPVSRSEQVPEQVQREYDDIYQTRMQHMDSYPSRWTPSEVAGLFVLNSPPQGNHAAPNEERSI